MGRQAVCVEEQEKASKLDTAAERKREKKKTKKEGRKEGARRREKEGEEGKQEMNGTQCAYKGHHGCYRSTASTAVCQNKAEKNNNTATKTTNEEEENNQLASSQPNNTQTIALLYHQ